MFPAQRGRRVGKGASLGLSAWAKSPARRAHAELTTQAILPTLRAALLRLLTAGYGPKRRTAVMQQFGRDRREADIGREASRIVSGAHDPEQTNSESECCNAPCVVCRLAHARFAKRDLWIFDH